MSFEQVDVAAKIINLKLDIETTKKVSDVHIPDATSKKELEVPSDITSSITSSLANFKSSITEPLPVYETNEVKQSEIIIEYLPAEPYPEDEAIVEREAASLRLPIRRFRSKTAASGLIIGVEKAKSLQNLALVRTLLEAAKYQSCRKIATNHSQQQLILRATDLYSYRRAPVAEQMLTLVLDYTCLRNCNWQQELLPYLSWAYVERASVCLIQVGVTKNHNKFTVNSVSKLKIYPEELRAERILARNILVPRISAGLDAEAGKATPLAHGLDMALQTLRRSLQHGRSKIQQAVLVVISDGRGNVPIKASFTGEVNLPVGGEGVENALQVAERIGELKGVKAVLLNPQPKYCVNLPLQLAQAMRATMVLIPPHEIEEVK